MLCTFWLRNVLRATTVCNFSSLICPDGSAPAALASLLFNLPEPQMTNHWKNIANRLSIPFRAPASSFFSLFLFSGLLSSSLLLSDSSTSAFPSVHIVGSLTSKLPYRCGKPMLSHPKMRPKNGHLDSPGHLTHPPSIFYGITQSIGWFPLLAIFGVTGYGAILQEAMLSPWKLLFFLQLSPLNGTFGIEIRMESTSIFDWKWYPSFTIKIWCL